MRNLVYLLIIGIFLLEGCGEAPKEQVFVEEPFVGGKHVYTADVSTMKRVISSQGISISNREIFGYKAYTIPYTTSDYKGKEVNITGLLVVPTDLNEKLKEEGLSIVSYGHGTIFRYWDRPSMEAEYDPIAAAVSFSSVGGFATLITDYIGYDEDSAFASPHCDNVVENVCVSNVYYDENINYHPYLLKDTLAKNSIDLIKVVKKIAAKNGIKLNNKLFVSGYSEGGFVAMGTLQKLEENNVSVVATAPMDGPYDLLAMSKIALDVNQTKYSGYTPALTLSTLNAYTKKYEQNISKILNLDQVDVEELLLGTKSEEEINLAITQLTDTLFRPSFLEEYKNNSEHWLKVAFRENSVNHWKPKSPIKLIHCQGDDTIPFAISENALVNLSDGGAVDISLSVPDESMNKKLTHRECFYPALEEAVDWFIEQRDK